MDGFVTYSKSGIYFTLLLHVRSIQIYGHVQLIRICRQTNNAENNTKTQPRIENRESNEWKLRLCGSVGCVIIMTRQLCAT